MPWASALRWPRPRRRRRAEVAGLGRHVSGSRVRLGRLDHVHIRVSDRAEAARGSLPGEVPGRQGRPLLATDLIDFDLCWAFEFTDPWGNRFELNSYEGDLVRSEFVDHDELVPVRYWPTELHRSWSQRTSE